MPDTQYGIVIEGKDKSGPAIKSAEKGADSLKNKFGGLSKSITAMPTQLSQASTSLLLFQNSMSQMGGKAADAANKLTAIAGLVAAGGPVGIAIAGLTAAVAAGTYGWSLYKAEVIHAEAALKKLKEAAQAGEGAIVALRQTLFGMTEVSEDFAEAIQKKDIPAMRAMIKQHEAAIKVTEEGYAWRLKTIDDMVTYGIKLSDETKMEYERLKVIKEATERGKTRLALHKQILEETLKQTDATKKGTNATKEEGNEWLAVGREMLALDQQVTNERNAMVDRIIAKRQEQRDFEQGVHEAFMAQNEQRLAAERTAQAALNSIYRQTAMVFAQSYSDAFVQVMMGSKNAGVAIMESVVNAAQTAVQAYAASAAAAAAFSKAGIPIIGPALAVAASSMIFGLVKAYLAEIPKAARGGLISSGTSGVDNQHVLTQRGEGILTVGQTELIMRFGKALERLEATPGQRGKGGQLTQVNNFTTVVPHTSAETSRQMVHVNRELNNLKKRGVV